MNKTDSQVLTTGHFMFDVNDKTSWFLPTAEEQEQIRNSGLIKEPIVVNCDMTVFPDGTTDTRCTAEDEHLRLVAPLPHADLYYDTAVKAFDIRLHIPAEGEADYYAITHDIYAAVASVIKELNNYDSITFHSKEGEETTVSLI